jgi:hypothetical protein
MYVHPMSSRGPDVFTTCSASNNPVAEPQLVYRHTTLAGVILENSGQKALREEKPCRGTQHRVSPHSSQHSARSHEGDPMPTIVKEG